MTSQPTNNVVAHSTSGKLRSKIFLAVAAFILWLSFLDFPSVPLNANLDPSWQGVLAYATEQPLQFGKDIVFTYGP